MSKFTMRRDHHGTGVKKDLTRFIDVKVQGTGIDPWGTFNEFLKKDIRKNIDIHRDTIKRVDDLESRKSLIAVGCTKKIPPQIEERKPAMKYTLETDHISFKVPESSGLRHTTSSVFSKTAYTSLDASKGWAPLTGSNSMINCVSTNYNIITNQDNTNVVTREFRNIDARRTKGLAEYSDIEKSNKAKFNPEFSRTLSEEPKHFFRKTGIFSHMYDAAARHGNITMPFDKSQDLGGKPAFKC